MRLARHVRFPALAVVAAAALSAPAWAADVFPSTGIVEILPVGEVAGDGATPVTVHVLARNADGSAMTGLKLKPQTSSGTINGWNELGDGVYAFGFVPPNIDQPRDVTLTVKGKTASRDAVASTLSVPVQAPTGSRIEASANPPTITLGQTSEATLSVTLVGPSGQPLRGADLLVSASSGEVTNVTAMGEGRFTARYVAPRVNYPHLAVLSFADRRDPSRAYGQLSIPLHGSVDYPVQVSPNATVVLRLGDREFGPVQASPQGRAQVPIVVPPGLTTATQVSVVGGESKEESIDLRVPETRRIHMVPMPESVPADGSLGVPVRVVALAADGRPDALAKLTLTTTAGQMGDASYDGNGIYTAIWTPPHGKAQMSATLQAVIQGSTTQTDSVDVALLPANPAALTLSAEPEVLHSSGTGLRVFARVSAQDGTGLANRSLSLRPVGATAKGGVEDLKGGDYRGDFTAAGNTDADVYGVVHGAVSRSPLAGVVVLAADEAIANDGASSTLVHVVTTDAWGHPVANAPVTLSVDTGDGSLPSQVTTDANGLAGVFYTAGTAAGVVRISARAGDELATTAVVQAAGVDLDLPISGTEDVRAATRAWEALTAHVHVEREGGLDAVAAAPIPTGPVGAVAAIAVTPEPAVAAPGGEVTLRIRVTDANGAGVAGQSLDLLSSGGSFGVIADMGGGDYQSTFVAPADATAPIKVSVLAGGAMAIVELSVTAGGEAAGDTWGSTEPAWGQISDTPAPEPAAAPAPAPAPAPVSTAATTTKERKPRPDYERPWLRARASFVLSSYVYSQTPTTDPGPLLPDALAVGGDTGGRAATPLGAELDATGWFDVIDLLDVGFHANFRMTRYAIASSAFSDPISDSLYNIEVDAAARVPIAIGSDQLHAGIRAGFKYDDFMVFRGCLDPGCTVDYGPVGVPALALGLEIGAEIEKAYIVAALTEGFGNFTQFYSTTVDANVGYNFHRNVFADVGFTGVFRSVDLQGADSGLTRGSLADSQIMAKAGVGVSF